MSIFCKAVRIQMLFEDNENVLPDAVIEQFKQDAQAMCQASDDLALRFYTCHLIADNWESIGAVAAREGVTYRAPDPSKYLEMYQKRLRAIVTGCVPAMKVSTFGPAEVDSAGYLQRRYDSP
jgi:hypothetical protein